MLTETITWHEAAEELPDADLTVLVKTKGCEEPVWLGYFNGADWLDVDNMQISVTHWADIPKGGDAP